MIMTTQLLDAARDSLDRNFRDHWKLFLFEGSILVVLGVLAMAVPVLASFAFTIWLGWLFMIGGVVGLIATVAMRRAPGFWWALLSDILGIVVGGGLILHPAIGLASLTYLLIAYFIIGGVISIMYALEHREALSGRWEWMLTSGIVDLLLAVVVLLGLPGALAWALGLIVGVNLAFGGASMIGMSFAAHAEAP
jgi:uncharacterized membrane protein HdeD (DUF308 family)